MTVAPPAGVKVKEMASPLDTLRAPAIDPSLVKRGVKMVLGEVTVMALSPPLFTPPIDRDAVTVPKDPFVAIKISSMVKSVSAVVERVMAEAVVVAAKVEPMENTAADILLVRKLFIYNGN
jgi:hypothetical protein